MSVECCRRLRLQSKSAAMARGATKSHSPDAESFGVEEHTGRMPQTRPRSLRCRSVRISPTTAVGTRSTAFACACAHGRGVQSFRPAGARAARQSPSDAHVLPKNRRLRSAGEIGEVIRHGARASSSTVLVYAQRRSGLTESRFGLAIGKPVGGSVVRHRVARRLRAVLSEQCSSWDARGVDVVVRAFPAAANATSADLRRDLSRCGRKLDSIFSSATDSPSAGTRARRVAVASQTGRGRT